MPPASVVTRDKRRAASEDKVASAYTTNEILTITVDGQPNEFGRTAKREPAAK